MDPEHFNTVVLVEPDRISTKSDAIIRIALKLKEPIPALATVGALLPLDVRDGMYDWVSEHRQIFGERDQCRTPEDHEIEWFLE
jgi:predicted DCC family thiol-disulfide oxidoreductase YuxK